MIIVWAWMCYNFAQPQSKGLSAGGGEETGKSSSPKPSPSPTQASPKPHQFLTQSSPTPPSPNLFAALPTIPPEEVGRQYRALGPPSYQEKVRFKLNRVYNRAYIAYLCVLTGEGTWEQVVFGHFIALTFLWVMRNPLVVPGWGDLFKPGYATDSTPAIAVTISLFVAPARLPSFSGPPPRGSARPLPMPRCLDWETAASIPWGIIMLLGCVHAYHRRIKTFLSPRVERGVLEAV